MLDRDARKKLKATSRYFQFGTDEYKPMIILRGKRVNPFTGHRIEFIIDSRANTMWSVCRDCQDIVPVSAKDDLMWQLAVLN